jgi:hypothetical protein
MLSIRKIFTAVALLMGLILPIVTNAAIDIATVTEAKGSVTAVTLTGEVRSLNTGDKVALGESIKTGKRSQVVMEFTDKSRFELGSKAEMNVSEFSRGNKEKQEAPSFVSKVSVGIFRFVSGLIARESPNAMKVRGAVATIGIRGTQVVGEFQAETATVILLEPEGEPHPTAIDVSNQFGSVTIDEPGYGTEVPDANSPPSPPRRMRMRTINNLMNSMRSLQRISVPRPRM